MNNYLSKELTRGAIQGQADSSITHCFFCIKCCYKFETSTDFLKHCNSEVSSQIHGKFLLTKDQEEFLTNSLASYKGQRVDTKIVVFLMATEFKQKFMEKYSHDLLVANEETAICLEELNNDRKNHKLKNCTRKMKYIDNGSMKNDEDFDELIEESDEYDDYEVENNEKKQSNEYLYTIRKVIQINLIS